MRFDLGIGLVNLPQHLNLAVYSVQDPLYLIAAPM